MLMEGIEAIAESAQAAKPEAHSPTGPEMKQESPTVTTNLGETPQFPLKRPRDSSADDPEAESKRLKVDDDQPPQQTPEQQSLEKSLEKSLEQSLQESLEKSIEKSIERSLEQAFEESQEPSQAQSQEQPQDQPQEQPQEQTHEQPQEENHDDHAALDLGFDMDAMIQGVMMDISNEMNNEIGKVEGLDGVTDVDMTADHLASVSQDSAPSTDTHAIVLSEPSALMRRITTSCLSNFAMQLLVIMSQHVYHDVYQQLQDRESDLCKSFSTLKSLLRQTRSIYSTTDLILDPAVLDLTAPDNLTDIQVANLASFCCELFTFDGEHQLGSNELLALEDKFFTVFPPGTEGISHDISELFLAVKTQLVIESVTSANQSGPVDQLIAQAFSSSLEDKLKARHEGSDLTAEERALVTSVEERKTSLITYASGLPDTVLLKIGYPEEDLFHQLNVYLRQKLQSVSGLASRHGIDLPQIMTNGDLDASMPPDLDDLGISSLLEATDGLVAQYLPSEPVDGLPTEQQPPVPTTESSVPPPEPPAPAPEAAPPAPTTNGTTTETQDATNDILALVAQSTQEYVRTTLNNLSPAPYQPTVPTPTGAAPVTQTTYLSHLQQTQQQSPYYGYPPPVEQPPQPTAHESNEKLPPSQSLPSAVLYDRARQAALSKTNNQQRREGTTSTRRPWTQEEEKALMTGLDMVQGPHWSQILSLFGAEGTLSNILKDRTQVQLKDKARNLKLFFLKTNSEMPYYLQAVTGELKTRAPTQAARKEAEERARMNSEEEQARVQGIMTLAGGLQHPQHPHHPQHAQHPQHPQHVQHAQHAQHLQQNRASVTPATAPSTPSQSAAQVSHHMAAHATTPTHAAAAGPPATPVQATPSHARVLPASSPYAATAAQLQTSHSLPQTQPQTPTHSHIQHHSHPGTPQPQHHAQQPQHQPQQQHIQPQVSQAAETAPNYTTDSSAAVYSQETEDLKEAALMQSLRELEAYSESASASVS
ncbi:myb-like DNA-binding domain-containing protein [Colletotrichum tamarilloi]|uniref:Myb-like DNA-binding domain-containing protein n=1 Tax=Colletotrichum tamarilloi TaxID=1209934 RepID=A0ABQ9RNH5_9PEZI|nr:myb-like DNA-binding domain-containing protein [Colletotrichum tamarilloi]KAK1508334.1 myb-like DNA-binding domain-containing protein [Colletotrichum tamarilloi]